MPWKSNNVLKEMIGSWYMVRKWKAVSEWRDGKFVTGENIYVLAECIEFEQNKDDSWWASFIDLEGMRHNYNQHTVERIMKFLKPIPEKELREWLELFHKHGFRTDET